MLWYQQTENYGPFKLIGNLVYKGNTTEDSYKERFGMTGDGSSQGFLHISANGDVIRIKMLISLTLILLWATALSRGKTVHQTPLAVFHHAGDPVKLDCSHSISSYNMILWYQQLKEESALKLIGYIYHTNTDMEASYEKRFNISGAGSKAASLHARGFSLLICLGCVSPGLGDGSDITQYPAILWAPRGSDAQMNCSHNKGPTFNQMYWYRQFPGQHLQLLVFTFPGGESKFGSGLEDKFAAIKTVAESGSLTVKNAEGEDSGVYFCASTLTHKEPCLWIIGRKERKQEQIHTARAGTNLCNIQQDTLHQVMLVRSLSWKQRSQGREFWQDFLNGDNDQTSERLHRSNALANRFLFLPDSPTKPCRAHKAPRKCRKSHLQSR
ncbi:uncharacterized protein LOC114912314 [Scleropages formosus]|uniref:uncharacterized protein LOC114912314 n=1 Tax=Scleropages formosus TaxID=113540 RepID=UPI0010FA8B02|nr:uncharacterized protein LOC114912314 [Scleropages formosus]